MRRHFDTDIVLQEITLYCLHYRASLGLDDEARDKRMEFLTRVSKATLLVCELLCLKLMVCASVQICFFQFVLDCLGNNENVQTTFRSNS